MLKEGEKGVFPGCAEGRGGEYALNVLKKGG
jgi:hypothetical protein